MIKHVVCFKLKQGANVDEAVNVLNSMNGKIPVVESIIAHKDFLKSVRSYDIILEVILKDKKALDDYQNDEYHCSVVKKHMHAVRESSVAVDYEF